MKACGHVLAKHSQTRLDLTPGAIVCHPLGSALRRVVKDKTDPKSRQQCREEGGAGSWEPPVGGAGMRRGGLGSGRELGREAAAGQLGGFRSLRRAILAGVAADEFRPI